MRRSVRFFVKLWEDFDEQERLLWFIIPVGGVVVALIGLMLRWLA